MQSRSQPSQRPSADGSTPSLKRAVTTRHLIMLSLGGAIGTGLFMGSGEVISQAGPLGAVLAYIIGGLIAYMVMLCLGELAVHLPVSGSFDCLCSFYSCTPTPQRPSMAHTRFLTCRVGVDADLQL